MVGSDVHEADGNARDQVMEFPSRVELETGATLEPEAMANTTQPREQGNSREPVQSIFSCFKNK
jgi:hypothetical protein